MKLWKSLFLLLFLSLPLLRWIFLTSQKRKTKPKTMRDLLGTPLIQGNDFRFRSERRERSSFWTAWLLAIVVLTPSGVALGKLAAARKINQMKECVSQVGDVDSCRKTNSWPFKTFVQENA